ncbi:MAG: hypothetical protein K2Q26_00675 [Bdellovibrionales bacterium]|nr:hypothetical protein [Bdellovibrionales bacterium]
MFAKTDVLWTDPLSQNILREGDRVTIQNSEIFTEFEVIKINSDDSVTIGLPSTKIESKTSVIISALHDNFKKLKVKDVVSLKNRQGLETKMKIDFIVDGKFILLSPLSSKGKMSFFEKIKFLLS